MKDKLIKFTLKVLLFCWIYACFVCFLGELFYSESPNLLMSGLFLYFLLEGIKMYVSPEKEEEK